MKTAIPRYYHLDVDVSSARTGQVRRILAAHLRLWRLDKLVEPVCRGTTMLLTALEQHTAHTGHATERTVSIELWWNGHHLITAVGGDDRGLRPDQDLRACLAGIAAMSDGWGCCASDNGSRIIWFSQRVRADERAPLVPKAPAPSLREGRPTPRAVPVAVLAGRADNGRGALDGER
ncbi:pep a2 [Streptomyces sp. NPDC090306]|uniref:pep a2 n=1 Tax=unclassified Streptomyces TaxID=2593676 RepID=UPI0036E50799